MQNRHDTHTSSPSARTQGAHTHGAHVYDAHTRGANSLSADAHRADVKAAREGVAAGLLGAGLIAGWFLVLNTLSGAHPLATPAALGELMIGGPEALADGVQVSAGAVLGYTAVHVAAFVLIGLAMATAVRLVERRPPLAAMVLIPFAVFEALFYGGLLGLGPMVFGSGHLLAVGAANLLAAAAMGGWLWLKHPKLRLRLFNGEAFNRAGATFPDPKVFPYEPDDRAAG